MGIFSSDLKDFPAVYSFDGILPFFFLHGHFTTNVDCHPSCQSCRGPDENQCLSCYGSDALVSGRCIPGCPDAQYISPMGLCEGQFFTSSILCSPIVWCLKLRPRMMLS